MSIGIRKRIIEDAGFFYNQGWMWGTSGNLSARDVSTRLAGLEGEAIVREQAFWITASSCDKGRLELTHFVKVDMEGKLIEKFVANARPSAEVSIHSAVYAAFHQANACYHVHSPENNVISATAESGYVDLPEIEMLKGFGIKTVKNQRIRVFENHDNVTEIAAEMREYFAHNPDTLPVALIKYHGLTCWGTSTRETRNYVELMEFIFRTMVLNRRL